MGSYRNYSFCVQWVWSVDLTTPQQASWGQTRCSWTLQHPGRGQGPFSPSTRPRLLRPRSTTPAHLFALHASPPSLLNFRTSPTFSLLPPSLFSNRTRPRPSTPLPRVLLLQSPPPLSASRLLASRFSLSLSLSAPHTSSPPAASLLASRSLPLYRRPPNTLQPLRIETKYTKVNDIFYYIPLIDVHCLAHR